MEKPQLDRREKIAAGIILAALSAGAIAYARKDGRIAHARNYPGGSFIIDIVKETKEKSLRISGTLQSVRPLRLEIDDIEHSAAELDEFAQVFQSEADQQ